MAAYKVAIYNDCAITHAENIEFVDGNKVSYLINAGKGWKTRIEPAIGREVAFFKTMQDAIDFANHEWLHRISYQSELLKVTQDKYEQFRKQYNIGG